MCLRAAQLKKLYADSREDMANSIFVPATAFNCESREPEKWSFYLRRRLLGIGGSGWHGDGGGLGSEWAGLWDSGSSSSSEGAAAASAAGSGGGGSGGAGEAAAAG